MGVLRCRLSEGEYDENTALFLRFRAERAAGASSAGTLFARIWNPLEMQLRQLLTVSENDKDDLLQQTAIALLENAQKFDPEQGNFSTWAKSILWHKLLDLRRRSNRNARGGEDSALTLHSSGDPDPSNTLEKQDDVDQLRRAVAELDDREQEALRLVYDESVDQENAARMLQISKGALRQLLYRARMRIREKLAA